MLFDPITLSDCSSIPSVERLPLTWVGDFGPNEKVRCHSGISGLLSRSRASASSASLRVSSPADISRPLFAAQFALLTRMLAADLSARWLARG
jgi:hypothetical protein